MWACTRRASRPASTASSTSRRTSAGVASASPGRVGRTLAAFRNRRSPLTEHTQSFHATSRRPVRRDAPVADLAVDEQLDVDVGERLVAERPRPPQPRAGRCRATTRSRWSRRRAGARSRRRPRRRRSCAGARCRATSLSRRACETEVGPGLVGVAAQHAQAVELDRPGVVHERPAATARPGSSSRSTASECWNRPVMLRRPRVPRSGLHVTSIGDHVVVTEPGERRHVEAVGEEVALGVAEVGAVEPHVGLVEDAVERDPAARARRRGGQVEATPVEDRPVAVGELGCARQCPGTASSSQSPSSTSRPMPSRRSSSSAALARHGPDSSTARAG